MYVRYGERKGLARRNPLHRPVRHGRGQSGHVLGQGRRRLVAPQVRGRPAPGAAGAGDRVAGPGAHLVGDRHGAARSRGGRRPHRGQGPQDRRLPLDRARAANRSTPPTPRCASPTCRPGSWWRCRTRRARSRTGPRPCRCCGPACSRPSRIGRRPSCRRARRSQVGGGGRSEKIRTYNYKENRVTDHRIGLTLYKLDKILLGELDELVDALMADERTRQLAGTEDRADAGGRSVRGDARSRPVWHRPDVAGTAVGGRGSSGLGRRGPLAGRGGVRGAVAHRGRDRAEPAPLRRAGRAAGGRRAVAVRDRPVGVPDAGPDGRPAGAHPAARDRAGGRGRPGRARSDRTSPDADDPGRQVRPIAVDLGTGSGAIALALAAERTGIEVWATDVSRGALEVAGANLAGLGGWAATRVRLATGSWWAALPEELRGRVDLAVSNPPYVASRRDGGAGRQVVGWEPDLALEAGPTGLEAVRDPRRCSGVAAPDGGGGDRDRPSPGGSGPRPGPGVRVLRRGGPPRPGRPGPQPGGQEGP